MNADGPNLFAVRTLVTLSLSSHKLRELLQSYIFRADCRKRFANETKAVVADADKSTVRDPFTNWGSFFILESFNKSLYRLHFEQ